MARIYHLEEQRKGIDAQKNDEMRICTFHNHKEKQKLEIYVNPHFAIEYQNNKIKWDSKLIIQSDLIFTNAKADEQASKHIWQSVCNTNKKDDAFKFIVNNGTITLTSIERKKLHENDNRKPQRLNDK